MKNLYENVEHVVEELMCYDSEEKYTLDQNQDQSEEALAERAELDEERQMMVQEGIQEAVYLFTQELGEAYGSHLTTDQKAKVFLRAKADSGKGDWKGIEEKYELYASEISA